MRMIAESRDVTPNHLPLRLCEVLEQEFVSIHGHLGSVPTWRISENDVDYARLLEIFEFPSLSPSPAAVLAIKRRLASLRVTVDPAAEAADKPSIVKAINTALAAPEELFDRHLLDRESDAFIVAEIVSRHKPAAGATSATRDEATISEAPGSGGVHVKRNRLLLEAAIPKSAIARADTVRLNKLISTIQGGSEGICSALCLSGGGIRSASFALGVLQGLARCGVLDKFDYLSTVSGGGYIGSWLTTWIHRHPHGLAGVVADLKSPAVQEAGALPRKLGPEPDSLRFLRSYSHFLNPKGGLLTVDTWSWVGIYLRNLTLNWLVLIPLLLVLMAIPRIYASLLFNPEFGGGYAFPLVFATATLAVMLTLVCVTVNRPSVSDPVLPPRAAVESALARALTSLRNRLKQPRAILLLGVLPALVFAVLMTLELWALQSKASFNLDQITSLLHGAPVVHWPQLFTYIGFDHLVVWGELAVFVAWLAATAMLPLRDWRKRGKELLAMLFAGLITWWAIDGLAEYASDLGTGSVPRVAFEFGLTEVNATHAYVMFAGPVVIIAILLGMTLFIGFVSKYRWIDDEDREWWARFGAWMLIVAVAWIVLCAITVLGPVLLIQAPVLVAGVGGISGLVAVLLGKSALTSAPGQLDDTETSALIKLVKGLGINMLVIGTLVFFVVFLAFLSLLTSWALDIVMGWMQEPLSHSCRGDAWTDWPKESVLRDARLHMEIMCQTPLRLVVILVLALTLVLVLASRCINLNKFSLHGAYKIRIVRTFLGASRRSDRRANPFTGFDPLDNVQMHELQPALLREADILNLPRFVQRFRHALVGTNGDSMTKYLVDRMTAPENDPEAILAGRLRYSDPEAPVLKSVQRDVLQGLNRILETVRLDEVGAFDDVKKAIDTAKLERFIGEANFIFANRLIVESAFKDDIRPYVFTPPPHKLMHVLNLTLNLVHGRRLAWQERKAAPFVVTPLHSGSYHLGFRPSREYGGKDGISIGTAAAVSGAAVSPNMGYSSSPVLALLLTLFNVRLGWWLGNPGLAGMDTYRLGEPKFSLRPLMSEALGLTDDQSPYVYLSDGGHFENLGLFEMVLRRCRFIVVSDAGADPEYQFEDLGNAVRKVRIDLGIPIEFPAMAICKRGGKEPQNARCCALGRIRYKVVDGPDATDGVILLIKPTLCGGEPPDVVDYAARQNDFPQEPTSDQFFGESQFESYRQLGEFETLRACDGDSLPPQEHWARLLVMQVQSYLGTDHAWLEDWLRAPTDPQRRSRVDVAGNSRDTA